MNPCSAAEKISDLFQVALSELETNIVSQTIKFSNQPQKLIEELQQSVIDFKERFYESLHHLLQFLGQLCGANGKEVLKIAEQMEAQVTKFKQQQLLVQMKQLLNQKLKALMETFGIENQQKQEIKNQIQQLKDSLQKIECTLMETQHQQLQYITPYPKKNFFEHSSIDRLTPNLSEDAERRATGFFITPEQRQQQPRQFDHSQQVSLNESSTLNNKTLNSFNKEKSIDQKQNDEFQSSAHFGQEQPKLFQNEIMEEYFSRIPLYQTFKQTNNCLDVIPTERTETAEQLIELASGQFNQRKTDMIVDEQEPPTTDQKSKPSSQPFIQQSQTSNQSVQHQQSQLHQQAVPADNFQQKTVRNQSACSVKRQSEASPQRLIQTSKSKEPISRCRVSLETTNLLSKLNQAEASQAQTPTLPNSNRMKKSISNKENQLKNVQKQVKTTVEQPKASVVIQKPKQLVIEKRSTLVKKGSK